MVPIYRTESNGRVRFTLSFYRDGRQMRKIFNSLEDAKKEALFVAHAARASFGHGPSTPLVDYVVAGVPRHTHRLDDSG